MISVCAYCRVSTDSRDQQNSFENQNLYFNRELSKNPDYKLYKIYADKGISGTKLHRDEFDKMLYDAGLDIVEVKNNTDYIKYITLPSNREPKFKYIFVKNTSRFSRNVEVESIFRDLSRKGVYVYFLDLGKSTENEADRTYIQIFCSFDERESRDKRTKVLFGIEEGNKKGVIRTNGKIFGYKYIQSENRLEIIEEEAKIVRKIFTLYSSGFGIRQIINILDKDGNTTRNGKRFCKNSIRRILDNEKYYGVSNNCKNYLGNDLFDKFITPKRKNDGEYELVESFKIPPIISKELFYECKKELEGKVNHSNQKGIKKPSSRFSGLLYCDICKNVYISNVDKGRHFYNCKTKKQLGTLYCNNYNVSENKIIRTLEEFLENPKISKELIEEELKFWYSLGRYYIEHDSSNSIELFNLKKEEERLLKILDGLYEIYSMKSNSSDKSLLFDKIEKTEKEINDIREKILSLDMSKSSLIEKIKSINDKIYEIEHIGDDIHNIDDLSKKLKIWVNSEGELVPTWRCFTSEEVLKSLDFNMFSAIMSMVCFEANVSKNTFNNFIIENNI